MRPAGQTSKVKPIYLFLSAEHGTGTAAIFFGNLLAFSLAASTACLTSAAPAVLGPSPPIHLPVNCRLS